MTAVALAPLLCRGSGGLLLTAFPVWGRVACLEPYPQMVLLCEPIPEPHSAPSGPHWICLLPERTAGGSRALLTLRSKLYKALRIRTLAAAAWGIAGLPRLTLQRRQRARAASRELERASGLRGSHKGLLSWESLRAGSRVTKGPFKGQRASGPAQRPCTHGHLPGAFKITGFGKTDLK